MDITVPEYTGSSRNENPGSLSPLLCCIDTDE